MKGQVNRLGSGKTTLQIEFSETIADLSTTLQNGFRNGNSYKSTDHIPFLAPVHSSVQLVLSFFRFFVLSFFCAVVDRIGALRRLPHSGNVEREARFARREPDSSGVEFSVLEFRI